jgi:hypothetical protein
MHLNVDDKGALSNLGQQIVSPMNAKKKTKWNREFVN